MRLSASLAGLFVCAMIFATNSTKVSAEAQTIAFAANQSSTTDTLAVLDLVSQNERPVKQEVAAPPAPAIQEHTIAEGESLSKIAKQYDTTWKRLFDKNTGIEHPDRVNAGDKVVIPKADEQLAERPLPVPPAPEPVATAPSRKAPVASRSTASRAPAARTARPAPRGTSAGNTYTYGYCTWYVKNRRPDLPNNLGNADTWVSRAAAQGIPTGSVPRAGAVGQRGMHVVYVERVNADGTIFISEMNRAGWNVTSTRTVPASYFHYIY